MPRHTKERLRQHAGYLVRELRRWGLPDGLLSKEFIERALCRVYEMNKHLPDVSISGIVGHLRRLMRQVLLGNRGMSLGWRQLGALLTASSPNTWPPLLNTWPPLFSDEEIRALGG
jgi:hypothetical protein